MATIDSGSMRGSNFAVTPRCFINLINALYGNISLFHINKFCLKSIYRRIDKNIVYTNCQGVRSSVLLHIDKFNRWFIWSLWEIAHSEAKNRLCSLILFINILPYIYSLNAEIKCHECQTTVLL